jgi:hypothetical protein
LSPMRKSMEETELRAALDALRVEHRDLDKAIAELHDAQVGDELLLRRLKKRKLVLRDRIEQLERLLEPDDRA